MIEKHEFGSAGWFAALNAAIERLARGAGAEIEGTHWSVCEVFVDVPEHLAQTADRKAGWHCTIRGREVAFGLGEVDKADLKITADYATALPLARTVLAEGPEVQARVNETLMQAMMAGKVKIEGSLDARPAAFASLHDEMVRVTA
jgi:hypothetical protein